MATVKTNVKTTEEFAKLQKRVDDYNELELMIIDGVNCIKERQYAIFFKQSQVDEFKKYVADEFKTVEKDGYFYCYIDLSNGAKKELRELVG